MEELRHHRFRGSQAQERPIRRISVQTEVLPRRLYPG